jgi:hypothetical protein
MKGYKGGQHVRIISTDGKMYKGPKGPDDHERFPRPAYVLFNEGPAPDKVLGRYGETLLQVAFDTIEIDEEHNHPPLIKGKITESFAAGGVIQMAPDCLDPGSESAASYQKKFFWKQVKSPKFRIAVGMPVVFATWTQRAAKYSRIKWPIIHLIIPDLDEIEASIKGISSPGLVESLEHYDINLEFGGARCTTYITSLPAADEHLLGDGKIEGEDNLFEQGLDAIKIRYGALYDLLDAETKMDSSNHIVAGHKLFKNLDNDSDFSITVLLNPYAFARITLEEWCIAAERFMIKQTLGTSRWKCRVLIIQKLDDWSSKTNWRAVNVLLPLTFRQYKYLTSVEFSTNKQQFYRKMDQRGRPGQNFGGDSSQRFHIAAFLFSPTESKTTYIDGGGEDAGALSTAEENLLPHFPVVAAVGTRSPSHGGVILSWNRFQLPEFVRRVTVQRCRIAHHILRHLTHRNSVDAKVTSSKLAFMNKERWSRGEFTNQMYMLGSDRYSPADDNLPIIVVGAVGGHNAIFASIGLRPATPLSDTAFRIQLSPTETLKDIAKLLSDTNERIAKSNKYQTPLFSALYLEAGDTPVWRQKALPHISLPGAREKQIIIETPDEETPALGGGTVFVAGLSATLNLDYVTAALEALGISESQKPAWATTVSEGYEEEAVYIEVEVGDIDATTGKTFLDKKRDVHVNVLRGSDMPRGYKVIERVPVFDNGASTFSTAGKPNLELSAAEELMVRMVVGGHGWKDNLLSPPTSKQNNKRNKTAMDEDGEDTGERKEFRARSSASGNPPPTTPPQTKPQDKAAATVEDVSPAKQLAFDEAGDSGDEDTTIDLTTSNPPADTPSLGQAETDALTLVRIKGKKQVLADYQGIFMEDDGAAFDMEGATEDQIDNRILELSVLLQGNVLATMGSTIDLAEAQRLNEAFTHRIEGIPFLRPKKKRPITEDGLTEGDSSLNEDPDHSSKKPRVIATAKKRRTPVKQANASAKPITMHFSPLQGKKDVEDAPDAMGDDLQEGTSCGLCAETKDTICGICNMPLCTAHSQMHTHGPDQPLTGILKTNLTGDATVSTKSVSFVDSSDVTLNDTYHAPGGGPGGPAEEVLLAFPKRHDGLDLVDTLNK